VGEAEAALALLAELVVVVQVACFLILQQLLLVLFIQLRLALVEALALEEVLAETVAPILQLAQLTLPLFVVVEVVAVM
jgi:hypothetical protein